MTNSLSRLVALAALLAVAALPGSARAQSLTWDPGQTPTTPSGGTGTWDNGTTLNWSTGTIDQVWPGAVTPTLAVFGGTAGTVTVSGTIAGVNGLQFNTTGYTITGGTGLTLTAPTVTLPNGGSVSIATPLAGTVGLTLAGGGTLNLTNTTAGANTLTGTYTVNAGNTLVMSEELLAASGNAFAVNGTLALTLTSTAGSGRYINDLQGSGTLTNAGPGTTAVSYRVKQGNFSGNITNGPTATTAIVFEATAGLLNLSGTNTYTGDTLIRNGGTLRLSGAAALPTGTLLRLAGGTLEQTAASGDIVRVGSNTSGSGGIAFEAATSYLAAIGGNRQFGLGATAAAAATNTLTWGTAPFAPTNFGFGSAAGDSTVTFLNPIAMGATARTVDVADGPAALEGIFAGTVSGTSTFTKTGSGAVQFNSGLNAAGFRLRFGTTILNGGTSASTAYTSIGEVATNVATLTVQGSASYSQAGDFNVSDVTNTKGTLNVNTTGTVSSSGVSYWGKTAATGIVNITAGTVNLTNTMYVGYQTGAVGILTQTGGALNITGGGETRIGGGNTAAASATSYGYYALSGGTFTIGAFGFQVGGYGYGVMDQTGGTVTTNLWTDAARFGGGYGLVNVSGGTFTQNSTGNRLFASEGGTGTINVFAGGAVVSNAGVTISANTSGTAVGNLNLLGGTLTAVYIQWASGTSYLYLNGGTAKPKAASANWIQSGTGLTATVGPNAALFDTGGFDATISQALTAPAGSGVTTIPITAGGTGYQGRPIISITGGGTGAGATANANVVGGVLTSITITNPGNNYTAAPTVTLLGGGATTAATLGTATFAANAADGGVTKLGAGVLTLSANNTFTGPLTITAGTVAVPTINDNGTAGPLGAQPGGFAGVVFNGGALRYTGATATSSGRGFSASGTNAIIFDVSTAGANLTFAGPAPVTANAVTKIGAGVLTLNYSTYAGFTGTFNANAGILAPVGTSAAPYAVNSGGRLNATYQAVATATVGKLTLGTGSGLDFDFTPGGGGAGNDTLTVTTAANGLTLGTTSLNLYQTGTATAFSENGTYPLIGYTGGFSGTLAGAFTVANSVAGKVYSVNNNTGLSRLELVINDAVSAAWTIDGGGSWAVAANWLPTTVPNSVGAVATFGAAYTGANPPAVVTLDGNKTVGSLVFNNANSYRIDSGTGGTLTIDNGIATALVTSMAGSHTVNVPVVLMNPTNVNADTGATLALAAGVSGAGTFTKTGAGTVVLGGAGTFTGATLVTAGTFELANATAIGGTPSLTVRNGSTLRASAAGVTVPATTFDINGGTATGLSGLANAVGNFAVDTTAGSTLTVLGNFANAGGSMTKTGAGVLTLLGTTNTLANTAAGISYAVQNGTLTLAGPANATYAVSGELDVGDNTPNAATLNVQSGTLTGNSFLSVSRGSGTAGLTQTLNVSGTVNVLNLFTGYNNNVAGYSTVSAINLTGAGSVTVTNAGRFSESAGNRTVVTQTGTGTYFVQNALEVGYGGVAQVTVGSGTTLRANQFLFGNNGGSGAILNRGVLVDASGASTSHFAIGNTPNSYGYYLHDTAAATTLQELGIGGAGANAAAGGGNGLLEVRSGTLTVAQYVTLNRSTATTTYSGFASTSSLLVTGGVLAVPNIAGRFLANNSATNALYTKVDVAGGRIAAGNASDINLSTAGNIGNITTFTVSNGGVVETTRIFATSNLGTRTVSFNNGTLRATASTALLDTNLSAVVVHDGGLTVDSNGFNPNLGGNQLQAPQGNGLTAIPLANGGGGAGYIGRPVVQITDAAGVGTGASAYATINETTGVVTGITITSPGSNYQNPVITLVGGGASTPATIDTANVTLGAALGTGGLTKVGAGILTISNGGNNYGGSTLVNGGTLLVANTGGSATGGGPVVVNTGGVLAGGGTNAAPSGFVQGTVTVNSGGGIVPGGVSGTASTVGNLSVGGLTLNAGSIINQQITDANTLDQITVTNASSLTIGGGGYNLFKTADGTAFSTNGVYSIIGYSGQYFGSPTSLSVLNPQNGKTYTFGDNGSFITLTIATAGGTPNYWNVDADGLWTVGSNWTLGTAPNGVSAFANFGGGGTPISAPRTVTLNAAQTVGAVAFNSANAFTIAGTSTLTLNNGADPNAQITVALGNHVMSVPLSVVSTSFQVNVLNATDSLVLSGNIGGTTNVTKLGAGLLTLGGTNTFAGSTTLTGGTLELASPAALGASTGLTENSGTLLRFTAAAATTVTAPVTLALGGGIAAAANAGGNGTGNFNLETAGGAVTFSGLVSNASGSLVKTGGATLTLTNGGANTLANVGGQALIVQNGTLALNGGNGASYGVTGELTVGDNTPNAATLTVASGTLNVSSYLSVGRGNGTTGLASALNVTGGAVNAGLLFTGFANGVFGYSAAPTVALSNAAAVVVAGTVRLSESAGGSTTLSLADTSTFTASADFQVGYGGTAVVTVAPGTTLNVAGLGLGNGNNGFANTGAGAIRQTGGTVQQNGGGGQGDWRIGGFNGTNDSGVYGSYTLAGGTFSSGGRNIQIGAYGVGVFEMTGGTWTSTGGFPVIGRFAGANGLLRISGGTFTQSGTGNLLIVGEQGTGVFTVAGGTATVLAGAGAAGNGGGTGGVRLGHNAGTGTLNLLGGILATSGVAKSSATGFGYAYLNGGTLQTNAANATFLQGLDNAVVGPAGATIDTQANAVTVAQNLNAPTGSGIATIPVLTGGSGYIGRPIVQIAGNGGSSVGATALANVTNGVVTSITITNPGTDYGSPPTITLLGGGATTPATLDTATLAAADATGGLTKIGTGTLTLSGANTYGGNTAVTAGTLSVTNTGGSATGLGTVTVASAATLRGTGTVGGPAVVNGVVRAGTGGGTLTFGNGLTVNGGGRVYIEISASGLPAAANTGGSTLGGTPNPTNNNFLNVTGGPAAVNNGALITVDGGGATFVNGSYSYQVGGAGTGFAGTNITSASQFTFVNMGGAMVSNYSLSGSNNNLFLNFTANAVPEPGMILGLAALVGGIVARRRKARKAV